MQTEKKFHPQFKIYSPFDLAKDWFVYWIIDGVRHKRKTGINQHSTYDDRMAAAMALVRELQREVGALKPLGEMMLEWAELRRGKWRKKTYQTRVSKIDCFLRWLDGREISNASVKAFFVKISGELHGKTVAEYRAWFLAVFTGLGRAELMDGVELPKFESSPAKYFQHYQVRRLEKHLVENDPELWLYCCFIYFCFIRPGELRMMRVGDIEFDDWKICVRGEIAKNRKTQRVVIPVKFRDKLVPMMSRSANEFLFYKSDASKPLAVNGMLKRFRRVLTLLGFGPEYQLYSWKHTGAVACVRAGASLKELQIQLRHHSLEEVDKYIRQLGVNDLRDLEGRFPGI